jgi:single-stranded DNA-binding protein
VIVTGRLSQRSYEKDGETRTVLEIDASSVGFDLSRWPVMAVRPARPVDAVDSGAEAASDPWTTSGADPMTGDLVESVPEQPSVAA